MLENRLGLRTQTFCHVLLGFAALIACNVLVGTLTTISEAQASCGP